MLMLSQTLNVNSGANQGKHETGSRQGHVTLRGR